MMPYALVTGASGFVGSHLVDRLVQEGWRVRVLLRNTTKISPATLKMLDVMIGSLTIPRVLATAVQDVDIVFHCAANVATWALYREYYEANVLGTNNLLKAISENNSKIRRVVHLSSVDVYGFPVDPADEQSALNAKKFGYGYSKLQGERCLAQWAHEIGIQYTILRPCNIIGPRSQFIERIGDALSNGVMLTIDGGKQNAGFLCIENLVDCMLWAASSDISKNQIYNLRDPAEINWADFISIFRKKINGKGVVLNLPFPVANVAAQGLASISKRVLSGTEPLLHPLLVCIFGRTCGHSIEKILADGAPVGQKNTFLALEQAIQWYQEQHA